MSLAFDAASAAVLLWLAWKSVSARDLFVAVVAFIVFGLVMAVTWARLDAPDVALAEAAVGAGITGALLLDCLGRSRGRSGDRPHGGED